MQAEYLQASDGQVAPEDEVHTQGHRHLLQLLDHHVRTTPDRTYASIPIDADNLSAGFRDISYGDFANAINHCVHWLDSALPQATEPFETIAYTGPKDIRYPILSCAIAKLQRKMLLPSPSATPAAQAHLLRKTECRTFLYGGEYESVVHSVVNEVHEWSVKAIRVPELDEWLKNDKAQDWKWEKSWEEVKDWPWFIMHTSGTTGFPKPIIYTHQMMTAFDASGMMPETKGKETFEVQAKGRRWYSSLPSLHMVGMYISLQATIIGGGIAVLGPPGNVTPAQICDTLRYGNCQAMVAPPLFIDALVSDPVSLKILRGLDYIYFAGAPLSRSTAEKLIDYTPVFSAFGTTEVGKYSLVFTGEDDWEWHTFGPSSGIEFERMDGDLHELIIVRRAELARWQQIFWVYPELKVFRTGDLWVEHKSRPGAWKVAGRTDDLIVFSHGKKMNAAPIEMELSLCPNVAGLVMGGKNKERPFILVEWARDGISEACKLDQLWPAIEKVNERCAELVRIQREKMLFTVPEKKLVRNVKGGPIRKASLELYEAEIEQLYATE